MSTLSASQIVTSAQYLRDTRWPAVIAVHTQERPRETPPVDHIVRAFDAVGISTHRLKASDGKIVSEVITDPSPVTAIIHLQGADRRALAEILTTLMLAGRVHPNTVVLFVVDEDAPEVPAILRNRMIHFTLGEDA
jgi:hypothetical protein